MLGAGAGAAAARDAPRRPLLGPSACRQPPVPPARPPPAPLRRSDPAGGGGSRPCGPPRGWGCPPTPAPVPAPSIPSDSGPCRPLRGGHRRGCGGVRPLGGMGRAKSWVRDGGGRGGTAGGSLGWGQWEGGHKGTGPEGIGWRWGLLRGWHRARGAAQRCQGAPPGAAHPQPIVPFPSSQFSNSRLGAGQCQALCPSFPWHSSGWGILNTSRSLASPQGPPGLEHPPGSALSAAHGCPGWIGEGCRPEAQSGWQKVVRAQQVRPGGHRVALARALCATCVPIAR